jgi:hypothetical protein
MSITTTVKEKKLHQIFHQDHLLLAKNPLFSCMSLLKEKEVYCITSIMFFYNNKGKKKTTSNPEISPFQETGVGTSFATEAASISSK